jgi:hypothetical protein
LTHVRFLCSRQRRSLVVPCFAVCYINGSATPNTVGLRGVSLTRLLDSCVVHDHCGSACRQEIAVPLCLLRGARQSTVAVQTLRITQRAVSSSLYFMLSSSLLCLQLLPSTLEPPSPLTCALCWQLPRARLQGALRGDKCTSRGSMLLWSRKRGGS